jgi:hypothetical protein
MLLLTTPASLLATLVGSMERPCLARMNGDHFNVNNLL